MTPGQVSQLEAVAGHVSRETCILLDRFMDSFRQWNARINLVAPGTVDSLWERHVLDSAQIIGLAGDARRFADIGSGGGFPGLILAILVSDRPSAHVDLVESNRKKAAFLTTMVATLGLPATVHPVRIDDATRRIAAPDILTARALAPLADLMELGEPWLAEGTVALFHKGRDYAREISECHDSWEFDLVNHPSKTGDGGVILEIRNLKRKAVRQAGNK